MPRRPRHLLRNLVLFGRVLRGLGLDVNPGRMIDLVQALSHVDVGVRSDFYHAARSLLVHRSDDIPLFDDAFEMFWQKPLGEWKLVELKGGSIRRERPKPLVVPPNIRPEAVPEPLPPLPDAETRKVIELTKTYSEREALRKRDFADLSDEELEEVRLLISELVWKLGERISRRHRSGRGTRLDLRRTLRQSLRHGPIPSSCHFIRARKKSS